MVVAPGLEGLVRMKQTDGETFHSLVKHQFGQLLSLSPQEIKEVWEGSRRKYRLPGRKASVGMGSSRLTEERVDIIYKVVEYLGLDRSLQEEGIFRKNAALRKKEELLERLESGQRLDLHEEEFSVHEAASALKALLAGLDEPLLTDLCFPAVICLGGKDRNYWLSGLRLLLQLVPGPESRLLKDLLHMLHGTAAREAENKMSASSLATIFMTHLVCPRWLKPEELQACYPILTSMTTLMVEHAQQLFIVPPKLVAGVEEITRRRSSQGCVSLARQEENQTGVTSLIASTVFSFVDREACLEETDPVLTQYKINRQILDLNGLPPGSPYVSSHDNQMPL